MGLYQYKETIYKSLLTIMLLVAMDFGTLMASVNLPEVVGSIV